MLVISLTVSVNLVLVTSVLIHYTGSYIFSQTIFNLRRGVTDDTRVCGWTVVVLELLVVISPVSVTSYLPKMFFGSLLVLIATDLMWEVINNE